MDIVDIMASVLVCREVPKISEGRYASLRKGCSRSAWRGEEGVTQLAKRPDYCTTRKTAVDITRITLVPSSRYGSAQVLTRHTYSCLVSPPTP